MEEKVGVVEGADLGRHTEGRGEVVIGNGEEGMVISEGELEGICEGMEGVEE